MIRVELPAHLRTLARVEGEALVEAGATIGSVLDALEQQYPALLGTIRDQVSGARRPFLRFFACQEDLSHGGMEQSLPEKVLRGEEPLIILGAIAGG